MVMPCEHEMNEVINLQNKYLSFTVIRDMLKEDNLHYQQPDSRFTHEVINKLGLNKPELKDALNTLKETIRFWKVKQEADMDLLVGSLNTTDMQLWASYHSVAQHLMSEDCIGFGRIGSLFFFTYILSKHLHREGREINSAIECLASFLDDKITPWLIKNHSGRWVCMCVYVLAVV